MIRAADIKEFLRSTAFSGGELQPLAGDASFRRYVRIVKNGRSAMLMDAPPEKEDVRPFIAIARFLNASGISTPEILAADEGRGFLLLEDLGDLSFTKLLKEALPSHKNTLEHELYEHAIDLLASMHEESFPVLKTLPAYDKALLMREVELFSTWYMPQVIDGDIKNLQQEYIGIWREIFSANKLAVNRFVHRDYHADNLLWLPAREGIKKVGVLDFQDGVYGHAAYDMVSLLEDARRDVPPELAQAMLSRYLKKTGAARDEFISAYALLGAQRNSKIVGIFTRLAARDGKHHYLNYLPRVWAHLEHDVAHPSLSLLAKWLDKNIRREWRGVIKIREAA